MTWALESILIDKLPISRLSSIGYVKSTDAHQTEITVWRQISFTAQKPSFTVNFPKWYKTQEFNTLLKFSYIWKRMKNSLSTPVKIGRYWISTHIIEEWKAKNRNTTNFKLFECNKVAN